MKNMILSHRSTFKEAIKILDKNGNGFLAIVDDHTKLIGILTDGDIRRAILESKTDLLDIINKNPQVVKDDVPQQKIITMLKSLHRKQMPVVNDEGILCNVVTLDDFEFNSKPNSVVIMAGGLGSRLGKLTKNTPKPMLHVRDKPILLHTIETFRWHGFTKFYISVNYKSEVIMDYFKDGSEFGVEIEYLLEEKKLGTGGALSLFKSPPKDPFFVINGDIITSIDFDDFFAFHKSNSSMATMCISESEIQIQYGIVEHDEDDNLEAIQEKPMHKIMVNTGIYLLDPLTLKFIPKDQFYDLPDLFKKLIGQNITTKVYRMSDYWLDIGNPDDYIRANDAGSNI